MGAATRQDTAFVPKFAHDRYLNNNIHGFQKYLTSLLDLLSDLVGFEIKHFLMLLLFWGLLMFTIFCACCMCFYQPLKELLFLGLLMFTMLMCAC